MARRELGPAALLVAQAVDAALRDDVGPLTVAVSGGQDSLALMAAVEWSARRRGFSPRAVIVDHQLQTGSDEVAARAAEQCRQFGVEADVVRVDVEPGRNLEAAARQARYRALYAAPGPIVLGHTQDDQAEGVLLGLARGSGARSLAGMAPRAGRLVRPLLGLRRSVTAQACAEWGLVAWEDPHNVDVAFSRVRVRTRILPQMEAELGSGIVEALAKSARLLRDDVEVLDAWAADVNIEGDLAVDDVATLPKALRTRVVRNWLTAHQLGAEYAHVVAIDELLTTWRGQGPRQVPGGSVQRVGKHLVATVHH